MKKKTNIIDYIPIVIAAIIAVEVTDGLNLLQTIGVALVVGFIVAIVWLLGKKLLAYLNNKKIMPTKTSPKSLTPILGFWYILIISFLMIYALMIGSEFNQGDASAFMGILGAVLGLSISNYLICKSDYYSKLSNSIHRNLFILSCTLIVIFISMTLGASLGFFLYHLFT